MKVSVVMACRDSKPALLKSAILSVLSQTYVDFEFIIVDDGSKYPISEVVHKISLDKRITVIRIEPSGLGAALNYGISNSQGEYIARLDDDDIMCPDRLKKQVQYLDANPNVSCLGTQLFDLFGNRFIEHRKYPIEHDDIIKSLLSLRWSMAHTALMYRRSSFNEINGYRIKGGGQDLDLLIQMGTVGKLANLDDYLVFYRMSTSGLSVNNPTKSLAYLFALNDVLERGLYPDFYKITKHSIKNINRKKTTPSKVSMRRVLLIINVLIRGRRMVL